MENLGQFIEMSLISIICFMYSVSTLTMRAIRNYVSEKNVPLSRAQEAFQARNSLFKQLVIAFSLNSSQASMKEWISRAYAFDLLVVLFVSGSCILMVGGFLVTYKINILNISGIILLGALLISLTLFFRKNFLLFKIQCRKDDSSEDRIMHF